MTGTVRTLARIAAAAADLPERSGANGGHCDESSYHAATSQRRLDRWRQVAAGGNRTAFGRLLAYDGLSEEAALQMLGTNAVAHAAMLPAWTATLGEVLDDCPRSAEPPGGVVDEQSFLAAVLQPLVDIGWRRLVNDGAPLTHFTAEACGALRDSLQGRLQFVCRQVLTYEIEQLCDHGERQLRDKLGMIPIAVYRRCGGDLVAQLQRDNYASFLLQYPVLAKMLASAVDGWAVHTARLLIRFELDREHLTAKLLGGAADEVGRVQTLSADLSDPHDSGQTVCVLQFESGAKVVYKPRSLGLDVAFFDLLSWWNDTAGDLELRSARVLDRSNYGWCEYIESASCTDPAAVARFLERSGLLLGLLYVLRASDIHAENVICCGEQPVIVDLECLLDAPNRAIYAVPGAEHPESPEVHTVLSAGFLPRLDVLPGGGQAHDPTFLGQITQRQDQTEVIVRGFERMYEHVLQNRETLLSTEGVLCRFAGRMTRTIVRRTDTYYRIFRRSTRPDALRDGRDHGIELESLRRALAVAAGRPLGWSIVVEERAALAQGNVPYFGAATDSTAVTHGVKEPVRDYLPKSGIAAVRERILAMSDNDLCLQRRLLLGSFAARSEDRAASAATAPPDNVLLPPMRPTLIAAARDIADRLVEMAVSNSDDTLTWFTFQQHPIAQVTGLGPMGHALYDGRCGPALFLAALDAVEGNQAHRDIVLKSLRELRRLLAAFEKREYALLAERYWRDWGVGAGMGLGSIIYTLCTIGRFYDDPSFLDDARRAARLFSSQRIADAKDLDMLSGVAGAALGLLSFEQATGDGFAIELAAECGDRLVHEVSSTGWKNSDGPPLTGFSHGAAGIAYALLRLYAATGQRRYLAAAEKGLAFEQSVFDVAANNWPDFRDPNRPAFAGSWCHGAPGIGLARLGGLAMLDTKAVRRDIEAAIQFTLDQESSCTEDLCCGSFGLIELLLVAAETLSRSDLHNQALQRSALVLQKSPQESLLYRLGFFQGLAGIGYGLLRLAEPKQLPCVLLCE